MTALRATAAVLSAVFLPLCLLVGVAVLVYRLGAIALALLPPIDWDAVATPVIAVVLTLGIVRLAGGNRR